MAHIYFEGARAGTRGDAMVADAAPPERGLAPKLVRVARVRLLGAPSSIVSHATSTSIDDGAASPRRLPRAPK